MIFRHFLSSLRLSFNTGKLFSHVFFIYLGLQT